MANKRKKDQLRGVRSIALDLPSSTLRLLDYLGHQSRKLYNSANFIARQNFIAASQFPAKFSLWENSSIKGSPLALSLPAFTAQQTVLSVYEAWQSYKELRKRWFEGGCLPWEKPSPPGYIRGMYKLAFPNSSGGKPRVVEVNGKRMIRFPMGDMNNLWFRVSEFFIPAPEGMDLDRVLEYTLIQKNGKWHLEMSYPRAVKYIPDLNPTWTGDGIMACDLGTAQNLVAAVTSEGHNFLIDARQLKSMNQGYNRLVSKRKRGKAENYWDSRLDSWTLKRNNQMRDGINKAARLLIEECVRCNCGTLVVGWNGGIKQRVNLGRNNQNFVQLPLGKLKERVEDLCREYGIVFVEQEESYSSRSSFMDGDTPPVHGNKPYWWSASGRRARRGLYISGSGKRINADLNGAANIMLKYLLSGRELEVTLNPVGDGIITPSIWQGVHRELFERMGGDRGVRRCLTTVRRTRLWQTRVSGLPGKGSCSLAGHEEAV